ncbi:MAG: DMT family transporter [Rhizobiaceae bacterium]
MTSLSARSVPVAYTLLTLTAFLWAGNAIAGKLAVGHVSPFLLTTIRWSMATLILLPFGIRYLRRDWPLIRANLFFLSALGAIGFTTFNNLLYLALNYTTAINVSIEQASMPLIVFALNFLIFGIRATSLQLIGFMATLIGVALTVSNGDISRLLTLQLNIGDVYMLIAVALYGAYSVALSRKPQIHWLSLISVLAIVALIVSVPYTIWEIATGRVNYPDSQGWMVSVYTAIAPSILAQVFWIRGLEIIGSNRGGVFINIVPIFSSLMAITILGEAFRAYHAVAILLVLSGVWVSQRQPAKPAKAPVKPMD